MVRTLRKGSRGLFWDPGTCPRRDTGRALAQDAPQGSSACAPQLRSPRREPALQEEKPLQGEACTARKSSSLTPAAPATRESLQQRSPSATTENSGEHARSPSLLIVGRQCLAAIRDTGCCMTKCHLHTVSITPCLNRNFHFLMKYVSVFFLRKIIIVHF